MRKVIAIVFFISIPNLGLAQNSWNLIQTFNEDLSCVVFKDSLNSFLGSGSKIWRTTDGGINWNELTIQNLNVSISKIIFVNNDFGIGVGGSGTIIMSTDGGGNWISKNIGDTENLKSICVSNNGSLLACSYGNKIYKSIDNGESWNSKETEAFILSDIAFVNENIGFGVGLYNTSIKTTDGGETWFSIPPIIQNRSMFAIKFINQSIGYVIGGSEITKTTDSGDSWSPKYNAGGAQLNDITTFGEDIAWVVGSDKILKTINGGDNWTQQTFSPYHYLLSVNCINSLICFAIGGEGSLYKTTDGGGVTSVNDNISMINNYHLYQNYPNPFNPVTIITYSIPESQIVELKVYDLIGNEVAEIVNEYKNVGSYSISFNANNLSSGIYFYKIRAGRFVQTKKLVLLK
jgi:photosystem II stability/assembly factor-like uncharacterized protein